MIDDRRIDLERRRHAKLQRRADALTTEIVIPLHYDVGLERVCDPGHVCGTQHPQVRPSERCRHGAPAYRSRRKRLFA